MSEASADQPVLPMTRDRLRALDPEFWTEERIDQQMRQWEFKLPSDPEELLAHARNASAYEQVMRGLNTDRREGRISEKEYQQRAHEANIKHFGEGSREG